MTGVVRIDPAGSRQNVAVTSATTDLVGNLTVAQNTPSRRPLCPILCDAAARTAIRIRRNTVLQPLRSQPQYRGSAAYLCRKPRISQPNRMCTGESTPALMPVSWPRASGGVTAGHELPIIVSGSIATRFILDIEPVAIDSILQSTIQTLSHGLPRSAPLPIINDAAPCYINPPWYQNLQFKMSAVYTLPWWKISSAPMSKTSLRFRFRAPTPTGRERFVINAGPAGPLVGCSACKIER